MNQDPYYPPGSVLVSCSVCFVELKQEHVLEFCFVLLISGWLFFFPPSPPLTSLVSAV